MEEIFRKLGFTHGNGLFYLSDDDWKGRLPKRLEEGLIKTIKPDAFFLFNNEPFILFFSNPSSPAEIFKNCWNFNQSPVIFIIYPNQIEIFNGFSFIKEGVNKLKELATEDDLNDFSYFNVISGRTWEKYRQELTYKRRVDETLLKNLEALKINLLCKHHITNTISNNLIGRIIFIRYLIDRKVQIGFDTRYGTVINNDNFCEILSSKDDTYNLFQYIQEKFNGNLFPISTNEIESVSCNALNEFINLLKGVEISTGQMSFFDIYDFSIIPIELVSNIYEFFIGKEAQAKRGAYYTPLFLVNYILNETVTSFFANNPQKTDCKVLDPACGSGVFLVETLRKIINQYQINEPNCNQNQKQYKDKLRNLLLENIFGIDKDENAINVAIFSLYVTLLDYLQPPEIVNFTFPNLLNNNFFVADFFDLKHPYNDSLGKHNCKFDFIVGNPPWGKIDDSVTLYETYWRLRQKKENSKIKINNKQIAQAFLIRISDFNVNECGFIITSKVLYNLNARDFRQYFLSNFAVRTIFELSSVRHEVFDKSQDPAVCPASVIFFQYCPDIISNRKNIVTHISLKPNRFFEIFKIFIIEKYDKKQLFQSYFMDNDWLWKVLVYGNILDFNFIKRLKENQPLSEILSDSNGFIFGKGICVKGGDENPIGELSSIPNLIDANKKDLSPFHIHYRSNDIEKYNYLHRPRNIILFRAPFLLIKKGIDSEFKAVSALSLKDAVFTDAFSSIKCYNVAQIPFLRQLSGIFNSKFFSYYLLLTSSSLGIEREQAHDKEEKFNIPIPLGSKKTDLQVVKIIKEIELVLEHQAYVESTETRLSEKFKTDENILNELINKLEKKILQLYRVNSQEESLIRYALDVTIPIIQRKQAPKLFSRIPYGSSDLEEYSNVFLSHFNSTFNNNGLRFNIEIMHSAYIIGMYFKVREQTNGENKQISWIKNSDTDAILKRFAKIGWTEISQELFVQKDIKGFEEDGFYVIKPNEYKCWHPSLAYMDVNEFIDALMKSGSLKS